MLKSYQYCNMCMDTKSVKGSKVYQLHSNIEKVIFPFPQSLLIAISSTQGTPTHPSWNFDWHDFVQAFYSNHCSGESCHVNTVQYFSASLETFLLPPLPQCSLNLVERRSGCDQHVSYTGDHSQALSLRKRMPGSSSHHIIRHGIHYLTDPSQPSSPLLSYSLELSLLMNISSQIQKED